MQPHALLGQVLADVALRLEPIIAARVNPLIGGHSWVEVLKILDQQRGWKAMAYAEYDLQPQLRILIEDLRKIGDPFFDPTGRIRNLAKALKVIRGRWAHMAKITLTDCWNAADVASRLFDALGDGASAKKFAEDRERFFATIKGDTQPEILLTTRTMAAMSEAVLEEVDDVEPAPAEVVHPDASMLTVDLDETKLDAEERTVISLVPEFAREREPYFAWLPQLVGDSWVITELPQKMAKENVRALALDIAEFEGPIELERLARIIAASFGVTRLYGARLKQIVTQIKATPGLTVDAHKFVWPEQIDRASWREFRPNDSSIRRAFTSISPVELANAGEVYLAKEKPIVLKQLEVGILKTFGRKAMTVDARRHIALGIKELAQRGVTLPPKL